MSTIMYISKEGECRHHSIHITGPNPLLQGQLTPTTSISLNIHSLAPSYNTFCVYNCLFT
uniref:Uncharacterized protein n=1 Tax=Lepeophtheirus salmonis TaxID=72036 RepID=A0A0K2TA95_LEPSM